jgi:hypothetical protein
MPAASRLIRACVLSAAMLLPAGIGALAQPTPSSPQAAAEQRIQTLQAALHITDAQMPLWSGFAQAMRDSATTTDALFRHRASAAPSMNALDNMRSYAQVARAYADSTDKLAAAFATLYGTLSDQQKQTIDTVFRQQSAQAAATQPAGH